ncbi:MAG: Swt1 family HEPN domain-containing protein [Chloroflexi bacterium]|nr:Swt1 family HEPN domain-containing protein [Chloroflexota bacterium]
MSLTNQDRVGKALEALKVGLSPFVEREFTAHYRGQTWQVLQQVPDVRIADWQRPFCGLDIAVLLRIMWESWHDVFRHTLGHDERSLVSEVRGIRNRWAHQQPFSNDDTFRALDSSHRLLLAVSAKPQAEQVGKLRDEALRVLAGEQSPAQDHDSACANEPMVVVIVCAASKRDDAGTMRQANGKTVRFVAHPETMPDDAKDADCVYALPDDISDTKISWRQRLSEYNQEYRRTGRNPFGLLPAYELYSHPIYRELVNAFGPEHVFILSGGWGLINAAYLTPSYDITFSRHAEKWKRRDQRDSFGDVCHIPKGFKGTIEFLGGKDYTGVFAELTQSIECRKIVRYNSTPPPSAPGCELIPYQSRAKTNWYYQCARQFINGEIES